MGLTFFSLPHPFSLDRFGGRFCGRGPLPGSVGKVGVLRTQVAWAGGSGEGLGGCPQGPRSVIT